MNAVQSPIEGGSTGHEGIAVVGIGCRFPGNVYSTNDFWQLLLEERDAIREVPEDRWSGAAFFDPDVARPGHFRTGAGGYLDDVTSFDADFFGITPHEAVRMDPQQRLFLETTWEALQDAGIVPEHLAGTRTAVYAGVSGHDYGVIQLNPENRYLLGGHTMAGVTNCIVANRVSYLLDIRGPSMAVDTACSSSLVAIHLACRSISSGEATMAIAGGVGTLLSPETTIAFSQGTFLSPDGRSKSFSRSADGYVRSEGSGTVILKPLSAAIAAGDRIYAVIRGSATNSDGRTNGISVPSADAQAQMILDACREAGIAPSDIGYVEAHGTGTAVGDPIEARALGQALAPGRDNHRPCIVGAVKSNVGHLEPAAGIAGMIKACLVVSKGEIPANIHGEVPNPAIPFEELGLRLATARQPWPGDGPRLAGVNSFGFGGSNAHVILQGPPDDVPKAHRHKVSDPPAHEPVLFTLSARTDAALRAYAGRYADFLDEPTAAATLPAVASTQARARSHYDHRLAMVCSSADELRTALRDVAAGSRSDAIRSGAKGPAASGVTFIFSGQGPQWWGMARELLEQRPVFRQTIEQVDAELGNYTDWTVVEELTRDETDSRMGETFIAQPAIFAVQLGLAALWQSWGIVPAAVVGHSVGEVAAAYVSGALSFEDAVRVIFHRSRVQQQASGKGKMLAVGLPPDEAADRIAPYRGRVAVAALNGPHSTALAGDPEVLEEIESELRARGNIFCRMIPVGVAFHSHHMDPLKGELLSSLAGISSGPASIPMYSTVTADVVPTGGIDAEYWWRNVREPVQFAPAIDRLIDAGHVAFVELGPHPIHATAIAELLDRRRVKGIVAGSLHRKHSDRVSLLNSLASLYVAGFDPDWDTVFEGFSERVQVPFYPWQRETYWLETPSARRRRFPALRHPLVRDENRIAVADEPGKHVWELVLDPVRFPWLEDHRVQGPIVFPAAGYLDLMLGCAEDAFGAGSYSLENVEFRRALFIFDDRPAPTVQVVLTQAMQYSMYSRQDGDKEWSLHSLGTLRRGAQTAALPKPFAELQAECLFEVEPAEFYAELRRNGLSLGPTFKAAVRLTHADGKSFAQLDTATSLADEAPRHAIHPGLLDSCITSLPIAYGDVRMGNDPNSEAKTLFLPVEVKRLSFYAKPSSRVYCYARARAGADSLYREGDFWIIGDDGTIVAEFEGLKLKSITRSVDDGDAILQSLYDFRWHPAPVRTKTRRSADFLASEAALHARVEPLLDELRTWSVNRDYHRVTDVEMNRLCIEYITEAFYELGLDFSKGQRFSLDEIARGLGVHEKHRRYLGRLLELLSLHGITGNDSDTWQIAVAPARADTDKTLARLREQHPECRSEYALLERCGKQLSAVLRDDVNPIELIFAEHEFESVAELYTTSFSFEKTNRIIHEVVAESLQALPDDRPVRVLEIGAGTGGATGYILSGLPEGRAEYVYSDISELFLAKARQRFAETDVMDYRILDIEGDIETQGFDPHYFDIVVASNVLHATANLRATLDNVQRLLTAQGLLLIMEATVPPHWVDLTFGMTEGWWRFSDLELRPDYPLLSEARWREFLPTAGFEHVQVFSDKVTPLESGNSVVVARMPTVDLEPYQPRVEQGAWVILADAGGVAEGYRALLGEAGAGSAVVFRGEAFEQVDAQSFRVQPTNSADLKRVLEQVRDTAGGVAGVLHLWNLDFAGIELGTELLSAVESQGAYSVIALAQAVEQLDWPEVPRFWVATAGAQVLDRAESVSPAQLPSWGILRVLLNEQIAPPAKIIDFDPASDTGQRASQLFDELLHVQTADEEVAFRANKRFTDRLDHISLAEFEASVAIPARVSGGIPFALAALEPGIEQLRYEKQTPPVMGRGDVTIRPLAVGLNFRDVMLSLGVLAEGATFGGYYENNLGVECAGIVTQVGPDVEGVIPGDRVVAFARGCFGTVVVTDARLVFKAPSNLSAVEAATLPMAYLTAWYALVEVGRLRRGERVLVHAAAGGVGHAAVHIARMLGATVVATAGSEEKRAYLRALGVEQVYDSRSPAFADAIREHTDSVDVVLNSLQGEAIPKSLELLRPRGRFVEIGKQDIHDNYQLGLKPFGNNLSYAAVDIDRLLLEDPALCRGVMTEVFEHVASGTLPALPHTDFGAAEVASAFRYMAAARQIGKVVVEFDSDTELLVHPSSTADAAFDADGTYLVTGGYTGFGLRTALWLVDKGARTVVLVGRRAQVDAENEPVLATMRAQGADVVLERADVSIEADVAGLLERMATLPPLRGVFHAAMVLDDASLTTMTEAEFLRVLRPKVNGAWHLHHHTRELDLDTFVMYSSMSWYIGTPGQANYAAANGFLEALAIHRRELGLPALTVNWGAIGEVGFIARNKVDTLTRMGWTAIAPDDALGFVGRCLAQGVSRASVFGMNLTKMSQVMPSFRTSPRLVHLSRMGGPGSADMVGGGSENLRAELLELPADERESRLVAALSAQTARIFDMPLERLALDVSLTDLGMDSLMAGQLRNALAKQLDIDFPTMGLMRGPTLVELARDVLAEVVGEGSGVVSASAREPVGPERWFRTMQRRSGTASLRVFALPFVGGGASVFAPWPNHLPETVEVVGIQYPGRENRIDEPPIESMQTFVAELADAMLPYLDRSFMVYGHSMGGLLAYELTKYLEQQFAEVPIRLIIGGWPAPPLVEDYVRSLKHLRDGFDIDRESDRRVLEVLRDNGLFAESVDDETTIEPMMPSVRADLKMLGDYRFHPDVTLRAPISVLRGAEDPLFDPAQLQRWEQLTSGGCVLTTVPGDHLFIRNPSAQVMATIARELSAEDAFPSFTGLVGDAQWLPRR